MEQCKIVSDSPYFEANFPRNKFKFVTLTVNQRKR